MADLGIHFSVMKTRIFSCLILLAALAFTACPTNPKKNPKKPGATKQTPPTKKTRMSISRHSSAACAKRSRRTM